MITTIRGECSLAFPMADLIGKVEKSNDIWMRYGIKRSRYIHEVSQEDGRGKVFAVGRTDLVRQIFNPAKYEGREKTMISEMMKFRRYHVFPKRLHSCGITAGEYFIDCEKKGIYQTSKSALSSIETEVRKEIRAMQKVDPVFNPKTSMIDQIIADVVQKLGL